MSVAVESLFTSALGLQAPWMVSQVNLDTSRRRIDFELDCTAKKAACPHCNAPEQGIHDRLERDWRHLDFFQFEDWLHGLGQNYITVVHNLEAKRLLFACEGRDHQTVKDFVADFKAHGGAPDKIKHVCMDISAAYTKGVGECLPNAQISYDRFHVVAMDSVRRNPCDWSANHAGRVYLLQRSRLKSACAWSRSKSWPKEPAARCSGTGLRANPPLCLMSSSTRNGIEPDLSVTKRVQAEQSSENFLLVSY